MFLQCTVLGTARSYRQNLRVLVGGCARKIDRRRALASADCDPQVQLLSGRDFVDSSIPGGAAEPTRGGRV